MPKKTNARPPRELTSITVKKFIDDYIYRIDLDADYQREKIWSRQAQQELIDSIIKNIDIPKIYLVKVTESEDFDYECIDGKQRMGTLLNFIKPEPHGHNTLTVRIAGEKYTYKRLKQELPMFARKIDDFELTFVIYSQLIDEEFLREIFRRLQLGIRLNSGELLKTQTGTIRDFVYKEMGRNAPFLRNTGLSEKRFSKQFTLAQICINSFSRNQTGEFVRARYDDLEDFFKEKYDLASNDKNLVHIRKVLGIMDQGFGTDAKNITSRAVAVSAYLFVEGLSLQKKLALVPNFVQFYVELLEEIKHNLKLLSEFREPTNREILEAFHKHISQASVESYAVKRRDQFLKDAFAHYLNPKTKHKIIGTN